MKKILVFSILSFILVFSCSRQNADTVQLKEGTPAYDLAKDLSEKVPELDPGQNKVLVSGDDITVTTGEVIQTLSEGLGSRVAQLKSQSADQLKSIINQNARDLAEKKLLLNAAHESGVTVPQAQIDSIMNLQYMRAGGQDKFEQSLQKNGLTIDFVKNEISKSLLIQNFLEQKLDAETEVSEADLKKAYNEDKTATVRHILLSTQGKSDSAKQAIHEKMEDILQKAKNGADFAELAKKYSEDPGSAKNGGLYKDFGRGRMVKPFEEAAFNTPVGEVSGIIETRFGYHILKVIDRKKETRPYEDVKEQLKAQLKRQKQNEAYNTFMENLKNEANLQYHEL